MEELGECDALIEQYLQKKLKGRRPDEKEKKRLKIKKIGLPAKTGNPNFYAFLYFISACAS